MASEKPEACDCCMFETSELKRYEMRSAFPRTDVFKWLCSLCAGSEAGTVFDYRYTLYKDNSDLAKIMGLICNVGNHILQELRRQNGK